MGVCKKTRSRFNCKHEYEEDKSATSSGVSSSESGFKTPTVDIVNQDPAGDKTRLTTTAPAKKAYILECCVELFFCIVQLSICIVSCVFACGVL